MPTEKVLDFEQDWEELIAELDLGDLPRENREAILKSLLLLLVFN